MCSSTTYASLRSVFVVVLSNHWVESCVAFNTQYSDSGLFGLYITTSTQYVRASNKQIAASANFGDVTAPL